MLNRDFTIEPIDSVDYKTIL